MDPDQSFTRAQGHRRSGGSERPAGRRVLFKNTARDSRKNDHEVSQPSLRRPRISSALGSRDSLHVSGDRGEYKRGWTARGEQPGFLIRDRDRSYGGDFIARARRIGIETILTPVRAPNANAIAERVIGTLRRECLDHVIAVNERHLRRVLGEYVQHYNAMRPHRSLALDSPERRKPVQRMPSQRVGSKPVLGGLHHEYRWAA